MTRSNKKAGPFTRKQPVWRRSRKSVHRSSAPSTSLRKSALRSTPPPPRVTPDPPLDERPTPVPSAPRAASRFDGPPDERPTPVMPEARTNPLLTERPVALPVASETESASPRSDVSTRALPEHEKGSNSWLLAGAALVLLGGAWLAFGNSGSQSGNSDASASNADNEASIPAAAPAAPPTPEPAVVRAPAEASTEGEVSGEAVIDLDAPHVPKVAERRVSSAKTTPKSEPEGRQPAPAAAFDASGAESALQAAAQRASSCRQGDDPTGVARVVVTFAPSGRVTSATISGPPFAGTQTGSCIARTMRGMSLPAFTGDHTTISKTVVIM